MDCAYHASKLEQDAWLKHKTNAYTMYISLLSFKAKFTYRLAADLQLQLTCERINIVCNGRTSDELHIFVDRDIIDTVCTDG